MEKVSDAARGVVTRLIQRAIDNEGEPIPLETARLFHEQGMANTLPCLGCGEPLLDDEDRGYPHLHSFEVDCFTCGTCEDKRYIRTVPDPDGSFVVSRCDECVSVHDREDISDFDAALLAVRDLGGSFAIDMEADNGCIIGDVVMTPNPPEDES